MTDEYPCQNLVPPVTNFNKTESELRKDFNKQMSLLAFK
jgi:hypothetical protein